MKNNKTTIRIFSLLLVTIFSSYIFTSCKKKDKTLATGTFYIHLHTNIDTNEVDDITALYADANGRHFGLNTAQFFLSNIKLQNVNGTMYNMNNVRVIKDIDSEQYLLGTAPIGTYNSITFDVGLDDASNALTPSAFTCSGNTPLASMWYGNTTQGYNNMKIIGFADTSATQNGVNPKPFSYIIGSAANRKTVIMPTRGTGSMASYTPYILTTSSNNYIHLVCDYGKLLNGVNFATQDSTDTYTTNPSLATSIANNIPSMFEYEE